MAKAKSNTQPSQKELILKEIIASKFQNTESLLSNFDLQSFSHTISLQGYQIAALKSAITTLNFYAKNIDELYQCYCNYGVRNIAKEQTNTASFWMATGSGKSIVMIKLIALLHALMASGEFPKKPIMLLVPNEKILEQFRAHVVEYNVYQDKNITMRDLKDYESTAAYSSLFDENIVFIGRSDLLDIDENVGKDSKAKRLNYKNFLNKEGWIVLLDEAHKGDSKDSVRKNYIREIAKGLKTEETNNPKGFIFNFSATFSDSFDLQTCAFNYNLEKFNRDGYGKNIAVLDSDLKPFKDMQSNEEQIIRILESFILFCAIKKHRENIMKQFGELKTDKYLMYHKPLIIAVSDKVNTTDAGIKLYFEAILQILKLDRDITDIAQNLFETLQNQSLYFDKNMSLDKDFLNLIQAMDSKTIRQEIFYAKEASMIEACKIKGNTKELVFKSKNAKEPFLLLNIGNIREWEKQYLSNLGIGSGEDIAGGYFQDINHSASPIQIMMGSKVFSEGWDSNRVNLICFINIGSKNAKKYVLQTIGRGVRIEPFKGVRKRLAKCDILEYHKVEKLCKESLGIETLFIMASQKEAIRGILEGIEDFIQNYPLSGFRKNKSFQPLLVPKYKDSGEIQRIYHISQSDFRALQDYVESFDEDVLLLQTNIKTKDLGYSTLEKIRAKMNDISREDSIKILGDTKTIDIKNALRILDIFFHSTQQKFDRFETLQDEICHYQKFSSTLDFVIVEEINKKIRELVLVKNTETREVLESKGVPKEYIDTILQSQHNRRNAEVYGYVLDSSLQEHYYNPLVIDKKNDNRIIYAIREPSEIEFLQDLQKYLHDNNNVLKRYDWCFSRIVENVDSIYIPYFDEEKQEFRKFYPDFIFWLKSKQNNTYKIFFIDPKGLRQEANARYKLQGFKNIFEKNSVNFDSFHIEIFLFYYNKQNYQIPAMQDYIKSTIAELFA